ncbi:MAG: sugar phosphate isomerase/epimerase family protein [Terriglobia bacterium]
MEFGLSTYLYGVERLNSHILDGIQKAGFREVEIYATRRHLDYHDRHHVRDVAQWFADHAVTLRFVHAPVSAASGKSRDGSFPLSLSYLEKRHRIDSMDEIKRALEVSEALPFDYLVVHLGLEDEEYDLRKFDAAFTSIEHLKIFAKERGVRILLENSPCALANPDRIFDFIHYTRLDLKVCIDVGHAFLTGEVRPGIEKLADLAASVHIHDNHRERDDHLMPFEGKIDWADTTQALEPLKDDVPVFLELRHQGAEPVRLENVRTVIQKLSGLGKSEEQDL